MKTLREHLSEALNKTGIPTRFHAPTYKAAVAVGRDLYAGIAPDMHHDYDSMRPRDGSPPDDSFHSHAVDGITQALGDYHRQNPEHLGPRASSDLIMHVAKHIASTTEGDDRQEHRAALTAHYANQRRKAAVARVRGEREDFRTAIKGRSTENLQSDINFHKDMAAVYKEKDPKAASHYRFMVRAHSNELKSRGFNPNSRSSTKPTSVNVYTKSGTVQRKMKLPPFQKA